MYQRRPFSLSSLTGKKPSKTGRTRILYTAQGSHSIPTTPINVLSTHRPRPQAPRREMGFELHPPSLQTALAPRTLSHRALHDRAPHPPRPPRRATPVNTIVLPRDRMAVRRDDQLGDEARRGRAPDWTRVHRRQLLLVLQEAHRPRDGLRLHRRRPYALPDEGRERPSRH